MDQGTSSLNYNDVKIMMFYDLKDRSLNKPGFTAYENCRKFPIIGIRALLENS